MFNIIGADGKQYGPVSADQVRQWIREGRANGASQLQPVGGAEWNGPAYDPQNNLIFVGEVDWCATVKLQPDQQLHKVEIGSPWSGMATRNPYHTYGTPDSFGKWAGWVYAVDADTGAWKWRLKSNYPIQSGVTANRSRYSSRFRASSTRM